MPKKMIELIAASHNITASPEEYAKQLTRALRRHSIVTVAEKIGKTTDFIKKALIAGGEPLPRLYLIYDGRAAGGQGTEDAMVMVASGNSEEDARKDAKEHGDISSCYSYKDGDKLTDEKWEWDWYGTTGFTDR